MKKVEVRLKADRKFQNNVAEALRGYLGNKFKDTIEFHNHTDEYTFNYDFSYIQYKVINGDLAILGIDKGGDVLLKNIMDIRTVKIGEEFIEVNPEVKITFVLTPKSWTNETVNFFL